VPPRLEYSPALLVLKVPHVTSTLLPVVTWELSTVSTPSVCLRPCTVGDELAIAVLD